MGLDNESIWFVRDLRGDFFTPSKGISDSVVQLIKGEKQYMTWTSGLQLSRKADVFIPSCCAARNKAETSSVPGVRLQLRGAVILDFYRRTGHSRSLMRCWIPGMV